MLANKRVLEVKGTLDKFLLGLRFLVPEGALRNPFTGLLKPALLRKPGFQIMTH